MAELRAEMKLRIDPEMTEEGKSMLRQMIREEVEAAMQRQLQRLRRCLFDTRGKERL